MISEAFSFYDEKLDKSVHNGQTATHVTPSGTKPFTPGSHLALRNKSHKSKEDKKQLRGQVFHEWKHGGLKSGSGAPVTDRAQAIAIALSESGESNKALDTEVISFYTEAMQKTWSDAAREASAASRKGHTTTIARYTHSNATRLKASCVDCNWSGPEHVVSEIAQAKAEGAEHKVATKSP